MRVIMNKAKIFMTGKSQAIRLPKAFRFEGKEVSIVPLGRGIVLQPISKSWSDLFQKIDPTDDFFSEGRKDLPPQERKEYFK
jgi:antitoxin VapB